jgi:hypothetical protein
MGTKNESGDNEMIVSPAMVFHMALNAGMTEDAALDLLRNLKPRSIQSGCPYYCPTEASRAIKRAG